MVYYRQGLLAVQLPSPVCPKCGSHRTQVVGKSTDAKAIIVRCTACGERSSLDLGDDANSDKQAASVLAAGTPLETVGK